jgi:hypothetical protein
MEQGFDTPTTHGICPECLKKQQLAMQKASQLRSDKSATG